MRLLSLAVEKVVPDKRYNLSSLRFAWYDVGFDQGTQNMKKQRLPKKKISALTSVDERNIDVLYQKASVYIDLARQTIHRTIDTEMVKAYWCIGRDIVEEEQQGKKRAEYGQFLLTGLSDKLTKKYGQGFSGATLRAIRLFYQTYPNEFNPTLGWIHYRALMRVHTLEARRFYEIEAEKIVGADEN